MNQSLSSLFSGYLIYIVALVVFIFAAKLILIILKYEKPKPRKLLTRSEYKYYFTLKEALPEYVILVQVGFAAMLQAKYKETLYKFLAKRADYVICDQQLNILLIIELDGDSHIGKEKEDQKRERLLTDAGYKVIRITQINSALETRGILLPFLQR